MTSIAVQTDCRESEAQTEPFTPDSFPVLVAMHRNGRENLLAGSATRLQQGLEAACPVLPPPRQVSSIVSDTAQPHAQGSAGADRL